MSDPQPERKLVVIGAGPVGVEAALEGVARGWNVLVLEAGEDAGAAISSWSHVPMFTPWGMVRGPRGVAVARELGLELMPDEAPLTGGEFLDDFLRPLAHSPQLQDKTLCFCEVLSVSRAGTRKSELVGDPRRDRQPFLVHFADGGEQEHLIEADAVLDCSGVSVCPRGVGPGGAPAPGEMAVRRMGESAGFFSRIPDLEGADAIAFSGKRILLVGTGHSAANALVGFAKLATRAEDTKVVWAWRGHSLPLRADPEDPLPLRRDLEQEVAALAADPPPWLTILPACRIEKLVLEGRGESAQWTGGVLLRIDGDWDEISVDALLALVGTMPDLSVTRELQVHTCYATEGPMALAATLLAAGSNDCMNQPATGEDVLRTTEPGFFVLGHKSYGRMPAFLLRDGYRQIPVAFDLLDRESRKIG